MKHLCVLLLFAAAAMLSAADPQPAAATPAESKPAQAKTAAAVTKSADAESASVLASIYSTSPDPASFADPEKAEQLIRSREEMVRKIQDERKRLLQEDTAAKKLRDEILLLNRKLASLLETKKTMIELNTQLMDIERAISALKPATPSESETPKADDKTDSKAENKAEKTGKE